MLAGGAALRAAGVVRGVCRVPVLRRCRECVLRQSDSHACRRADEEGQQAKHCDEAGERAPHGVSVGRRRIKRVIQLTQVYRLCDLASYADQRDATAASLPAVTTGATKRSSWVRSSRGRTLLASGSRAATVQASRTLRMHRMTSWNCSTDS